MEKLNWIILAPYDNKSNYYDLKIYAQSLLKSMIWFILKYK